MILSLRASVSPCFILIRFLSKHFIAYLWVTTFGVPRQVLPKLVMANTEPTNDNVWIKYHSFIFNVNDCPSEKLFPSLNVTLIPNSYQGAKKHNKSRTYILPVSAFLHPYTSPKPPLPMILCTLKSFIVNCEKKTFVSFENFLIIFYSLLLVLLANLQTHIKKTIMIYNTLSNYFSPNVLPGLQFTNSWGFWLISIWIAKSLLTCYKSTDSMKFNKKPSL